MPLHLVYGGTFDPIHNGHLAIARAARDALDCPVRLMPTADPPHRTPPGAPAAWRARMVELAIAGEPGLLLDRFELERGGRSYTVDTLIALRAALGPAQPLAWLVGADSFVALPTWHRWRELPALAHFVVAERQGSPLDAALPPALDVEMRGRWASAPDALTASPAGRVYRLRQPLHPLSATAIRARIAEGLPVSGLVPDAVAAFIREKGAYRQRPAAPL
ncbi:nicotinate-nucleotide adenylyltransferase [Luteimonas sp. BDR2-5]|uniref:nicotinate-nucleotide adenylyltransferase n=1 Tax=Proluteimonas luteida TaxID=2878685 RepID=UPI001E5E8959|nr:nicotinate-nucleotide adenylyltransferase [Luteimonas sp. BDR2-5]MCD9028089.1 nicotinate-nucleotide adenylyltransferase [Luteimonas sp. BDR2-5]